MAALEFSSKPRRPRRAVWPIGGEGWTLPALTLPTQPNPTPYPSRPVVHVISEAAGSSVFHSLHWAALK